MINCMAATKKPTLVDVAKIGRLGGKARAKNLSEKELSDSGRKAAKSRWASATAEERAAHGRMLAKARAKKQGTKTK
jgi:hypothetical protein